MNFPMEPYTVYCTILYCIAQVTLCMSGTVRVVCVASYCRHQTLHLPAAGFFAVSEVPYLVGVSSLVSH